MKFYRCCSCLLEFSDFVKADAHSKKDGHRIRIGGTDERVDDDRSGGAEVIAVKPVVENRVVVYKMGQVYDGKL